MANSVSRASVSQTAADRLIEAAAAKAAEIGVNSCIAVVDESGTLKAFRRMDGAPLLSVDIAINKAWTSVSFGIPTHGWFDFIKNDPPLLHGITHTPRLVVFGGGYPITENGQVIGGIGLSGGHYSQDQEIAEAALAALGE
jgi:uncharacterized protein GlcG (DUF336 family)